MPTRQRMTTSCPNMREQIAIALVLSTVAGYIDAFGWLTLYHVYTANMSGNAIAFGVHGIHGGWTRAVERGVPVLFFAVGVGVSELAMEVARRYRRIRIIAAALAVEILLLSGLIVGGHLLSNFPLPGTYPLPEAHQNIPPAFLAMVALAAVAMGVQNASVRRVGAMSVHTTHITGAITSCVEHLATLATWLFDRMAGHSWQRKAAALRSGLRRRSLRDALILLAMFLVYVGGAVAGALCLDQLRLWCLLIPIAALTLAAAYECRRPTPILRIGRGERTPRGSRTP